MTEVPAGWRRTTLGEVVDVLDHQRIPVSAKERAARTGDVPYYGAAGQVGTIDRSLFDEPLVLLGEDGVQFFDRAKRKAYLVDGPAWVNNHAHVLRAREHTIGRRFLHHQLNTIDYRGFANGTTRLKLTQAAMRSIPLSVPPIGEQRRIIDVLEDHLSRLDAAAGGLVASSRRLKTWRTSKINGLVWGPGDPRVTAVRDLLAEPMRNGYSARAIQGGEAGVRTLTLTAVTRSQFDEKFTKMTVADPARVDGLWLKAGDIFVQRANTHELVGTTALYEGPDNWAIYPDLLIRLRVDPQQVDPRYLAAALGSERAHAYLRSKAKGLAGSMPKIDQAAISSTQIPLPDIEAQRLVVRELQEAEAVRDRTESQLVIAQRRGAALRRALLSAAFSGRLTGTSTDTEVVEEIADSQGAS